MPFAIIFLAILLIVTGFKGTTGTLFSMLAGDVEQMALTILAIAVVGAVGYIPGLKKVSDGFLILILLVYVLSNKGFFAAFNTQFNQFKNSSISDPTSGLQLQPMGLETGIVSITPQANSINPLEGITSSSVSYSDLSGGF
jgi:hypothetical protein